MIGHLRIKSPWSQLGIFLGLFGAAFIFSSILMAIAVLAKGWSLSDLANMDWTDPAVLSTMKWMQAISSISIFLLPALVYALITFRNKPFYFLGFRKAQHLNMYVLAVLCILLAFPFVFWLGELNQHITLPKWMTGLEKDASKQMEAFLKVKSSWDVVINILIIALLPAICEEICFRGALQRILIHIFKSPWAGIIITSILFSALHMQFQGFLPRMFLGIVLGALYWYSNSLWPNIIAHFVNNGVQVVAVSYAPKYVNENPSMPVFAALFSGAAVLAILWYYQRQSTVSYERVYEPDELNESNQFMA